MAAGAFYALNEADETINSNYLKQVQAQLSTVSSDLHHYVHRINSDYYQLINMSLSNVLSLNEEYFDKDPLLSFFDKNIRTPSAYAQGENLVYALEALNYFKIPYVSYNFDSKKLEVVGTTEEKDIQRLLKATTQDGSKLEDLIKEPSNLSQSFAIMFGGSKTYLCLKLYDRSTRTNYYILDDYLSVLDNTALNVKHIFSDMDPMMQGILKDDNVMIVRRGKPVFTTEDFKVKLDTSSANLRNLLGVFVVDQNGKVIENPEELQEGAEAYILATTYLRSINSYILLHRPFDIFHSGANNILIIKIALWILALGLFGLIFFFLKQSSSSFIGKRTQFEQIVKKLQNLSYEDLRNLLAEARQALDEHKKQLAAQNAVNGEAALEATAASDSTEGSDAQAKALEGDAADLDASANAAQADNKSDSKAADESSTKNDAQDTKSASASDAANSSESSSSSDSDANKSNDADAKDNASTAVESTKGNKDRKTRTRGRKKKNRSNNENPIDNAPVAADAKAEDKGSSNDQSAADKQDSSAVEAASTSSASPQDGKAVTADNKSTEVESKDHAHDKADHESSYEEPQLVNQLYADLNEEDRRFVEHYLVTEFLKGTDFRENSIVGQLVAQAFKLTEESDQYLSNAQEQLKEQFRSRIPVFRKEGQLVAARSILLNALPSEDAMPSSSYVDFAAFTVPAREVTGNYYTIERLDDNNLAFVIADCNSSGVTAAYTVVTLKALIEEALKLDMAPPQMMSFINLRLCAMSNISSVALFIGIISEQTGNIIACSAGHVSPIVIDDRGPRFMCQPNNKRLGVKPEEQFELSKCYLANNDMLVLFSQGIANVMNAQGEAFGLNRLYNHCIDANNLRADELIIKILNDIKAHKGKRPFTDDVSLLCLKQLLIHF